MKKLVVAILAHSARGAALFALTLAPAAWAASPLVAHPPADFAGTGRSALIWHNTNGAAALWLMNGTTQTSAVQFGPYAGWSVLSGDADFNGDGKSDLLWTHTNGAAAVWLMNGTTQVGAASFGPYPGWSVVSGNHDFNGDGKSDLLWKNTDGSVAIWLMNGTTVLSQASFGPYTGWSIVSGNNDFNGDGKSDLLWKNSNGAAALWLMDGTTQTSATQFGPYTGWSIVSGSSDYDGDGKTDLLWQSTDGAAALWLMNGLTQTSATQFGPYTGWTVVSGKRDFNGDGKSDLLWSNTNGAAAVWLMNGLTQTSAASFGPFTGWSITSGIGDYNGDGMTDLLWSNTDGSAAVWSMNGTTQQSAASFGPYSGWSIVGSGSTTCDITITTSTNPGYSQIEAASPGQTVCIAPGTYHFRVWLHKTATAALPITIRALDPARRPVFDYSGWTTGWVNGVPPFPGSYSGSDAYRSAWRVDGSYYTIDGIIVQNANNAGNVNFDNTAGLRYLNSTNLTVRNSRFYRNDMGIQGGGSNTVIEYSEFDRNGYSGSDQSHNIYILGGDNFTLRNSYSHDCIGGQDFHIRARNATVAYNWFQNASDYEGDMMTNQANYDPGITGTQNLLLLGNVFVQNAAPDNQGKFMTLYNDTATANVTFNLTSLWNTFVFNDTYAYGAGVIQVRTDSLAASTVVFSNNLVAGAGTTTSRSAVVTSGGSAAFSLSGSGNFFLSGFSGHTGALSASIFAADPKFTNPTASDYSLQSGSPATGTANTGVGPQPQYWFATPAPIGNPTSTPPAIDPPGIADIMATRAGITNPGAMQP